MPKSPGHRLRRPALLAIVAVTLMAATLYAQPNRAGGESVRPETARASVRPETARPPVNLYFADPARFALLAEPRPIPGLESPVALGRHIIQELTTGPRGEHLGRTLPRRDILRAFFIATDKTAYVDLHDVPGTGHPGGIQADLLAVYSIVNSLVLNLAEIDAVKFLSSGREPLPAAGHLDLRYPLKANILLIR